LDPTKKFRADLIPKYVPNLSRPTCQVCDKKFGAIAKRILCKCCGRVVCSTCITNEHYLAPGVLAQVCDVCFAEIRKSGLPYNIPYTAQAIVRQESKSPLQRLWEKEHPELIQKERTKIAEETKPPAIFIPFNEVDKCMVCNGNFSLLEKKNHCHSCGKVVCSQCSNKKLLLKNVDAEHQVPVCNSCYFSHFA